MKIVSIHLPEVPKPNAICQVFEDNLGVLELANTLLPKLRRPRTKHLIFSPFMMIAMGHGGEGGVAFCDTSNFLNHAMKSFQFQLTTTTGFICPIER